MKEESFWEFRRRIDPKKTEISTQMEDESGKLTSDPGRIKEIYQSFYEKLFIKRKSETKEEKEAELKVNKKIEEIKERAKTQTPIKIEIKDVAEVVRKLKNRKAGDEEGWRNEMIKAGGQDMVEALTKIFNLVLREQSVPKQWESVIVKSIYKNKGKKSLMKNRRGIFLTSIVGKVFEKVLLQKVTKDIKIDKHQNGGLKGRSTKDNWIALMAVIDMNRHLKRNTYI